MSIMNISGTDTIAYYDSDKKPVTKREYYLDDIAVYSRAIGYTIGQQRRGEPIGFFENWLTDLINSLSYNHLGMHDEDGIAKKVQESLFEHNSVNFETDDQYEVEQERKKFADVYYGGPYHYKGRYWRVFSMLLNRYLIERDKGVNFENVEGWMFDTYAEMFEALPEEVFPPVLMNGCCPSIHPNMKFGRKPSSKDGGRIVKGVMAYITDSNLFGKQYAKRPKIDD